MSTAPWAAGKPAVPAITMSATPPVSGHADGGDESRRPRLQAVHDDTGVSVSSASTMRSPGLHHSRTPSVRRRAETQDSDKAGRSWAREVDDPWWPCILTLDGGGIRGYSSLLILKALMHEVWEWEKRLDEEDSAQGELFEEPEASSPRASNPPGHKPNSASEAGEVGYPHLQLGSDPKHAEPKYGVNISSPSTENINVAPAKQTVQKENLAADVSHFKAASEEELLPCHYFDFMYGTSTGGLIATILGRLRMTVSEGLELYRKVGEDLFGKRRSNIPLMTKYYHEPLERAVQEIVGARCHEHPSCNGKDDLHPWDCDRFEEILQQPDPFDVDRPRLCQSCCLTATHDENLVEAYLLRSYPHYYKENAPNWVTRYNEGADLLPIWKVTRATTAAPFYFVSDMISIRFFHIH